MINIVIPIAGENTFFQELAFPVPLMEINGKTIIEHLMENYASIEDKRFIFILKECDTRKFHLDESLKRLDDTCKIITVANETKGAACSVMLASEYIDNDTPLIIANVNQLFDVNLKNAVEYFSHFDAGVITFTSIHPKYSYAKTNAENNVIQVAEKQPISKNAIAGFFYFSKGRDFIKASENMIKKDVNYGGQYFVATALNELILQNKNVTIFAIDKSAYHIFYNLEKIREYERIQNNA